MPDFLLELRSEEIPARMQPRAAADLARLFTEQLNLAGLTADVETHATPRRLALIARGLPEATDTTTEERRGPRADAPAQALEGFLKSTGLTRDQLEARADKKGTFLYAVIARPGRPTADVLAEAIPAIVRAFPWPKSMRWGAASASTESPRWVRPLQGIVALLGEHIVPMEIAGIHSGAATLGHRFHHPGIITIGGADDYEAKLRACHVILRTEERAQIIREGATQAAAAAGLALVPDEGLVAENAGLTEWPVPLLGRFDPAFLAVPPEVIQLTMRTNQKYFALTNPPRYGEGDHAQHGGGGVRAATELAPAFVCTANIAATDGGAGIVRGNERVLSARLSDAKFFWEADLEVPLDDQTRKLDQIVFHEKLGTLADKVDRVARLARWLVEEGIVKSSPERGGGSASALTEGAPSTTGSAGGPPPRTGVDQEHLADLTERAATLSKADLVTQMVGEFPELQGTIGAHLARAQGEDPQVCNAIRDHYKPVGQSDEVPTEPVTVAVSLADKLDTFVSFFRLSEFPTGSRDPYALRRAVLAIAALMVANDTRLSIRSIIDKLIELHRPRAYRAAVSDNPILATIFDPGSIKQLTIERPGFGLDRETFIAINHEHRFGPFRGNPFEDLWDKMAIWHAAAGLDERIIDFAADRLKVQQREAGVRHDLIDAVFALGGEDDLVRLLARVHALQAFVETVEGRDLLAGYKRAANILKKEGYEPLPHLGTAEGERTSASTLDPAEQALAAALDDAEPRARASIAAEDFGAAMAALASLRAPVDAFFENVIVNDADPVKREARLALLARMREAVHAVADFSKIES